MSTSDARPGCDITLRLESRPTTAEVSIVQMLRTLEGVIGIQGVEPCKALMSLRSLYADMCLLYDSLGDVELGLQGVHLTLDVEDASVGLVELAQLSKQSPVIDLPGCLHNLVKGHGIPLYCMFSRNHVGSGLVGWSMEYRLAV